MSEVIREFDANEEKVFFNDVQDEALETAACATAANKSAFTLSMCTANTECPF
jgi:hypothetical protein